MGDLKSPSSKKNLGADNVSSFGRKMAGYFDGHKSPTPKKEKYITSFDDIQRRRKEIEKSIPKIKMEERMQKEAFREIIVIYPIEDARANLFALSSKEKIKYIAVSKNGFIFACCDETESKVWFSRKFFSAVISSRDLEEVKHFLEEKGFRSDIIKKVNPQKEGYWRKYISIGEDMFVHLLKK